MLRIISKVLPRDAFDDISGQGHAVRAEAVDGSHWKDSLGR